MFIAGGAACRHSTRLLLHTLTHTHRHARAYTSIVVRTFIDVCNVLPSPKPQTPWGSLNSNYVDVEPVS